MNYNIQPINYYLLGTYSKKPASFEAGCGVFRVKWYKFPFSLFDLNQLNNFSAVTLNEFCKVITRLIVVSDLNRTVSA